MKFQVCPDAHIFSLTSPCEFSILRTALPLILILIYLLTHIPLPKPLLTPLKPYSILLHDQATIESLAPDDVKAEVKGKERPGTELWRLVVFVGVGVAQVAAWMGVLGWVVVTSGEGYAIWSSIGMGLVWLYLTITPLLKPTQTPPWKNLILYTLLLSLSVISLGSVIFHKSVTGSLPLWASKGMIVGEILNASSILCLIAVVLGMRLGDAAIISRMPDAMPEDHTTLYAWLTFSWVGPLIKLGNSKDLLDSEVPRLSPTQTTDTCFTLLQHTVGSTLLRRIFKANGFDFFMDFTGTIVAVVFNYLSPYFIKQILEGIASPTQENISRAYVYAFLALLSSLVKAQADLQHLWFGRRAAVRMKSMLIAVIYDKGLRRKDASGVISEKEEKEDGGKDGKGKKKGEVEEKRSSDSGRVVNLMASDTSTLANLTSGAYQVYGAPVDVVIALVFLYSLLGWSAFAGLSILLLATPLNKFVAAEYQRIAKERSKATDKRIQVMNELIGSIKFIKFFAWTQKWQEKAARARKNEVDQIILSMWNNVAFMGIWMITPLLVSLISFTSFILIQKKELTVAIAFTSISLFSMIRQPLNMMPTFYVIVLRALVSVKRIDDYLAEDEVEDWVCSLMTEPLPPSAEINTRIGFENATLTWNSGNNDVKPKDAPKPGPPTLTINGASTVVNGNGNDAVSETSAPPVFELIDLNVTFPVGKMSVISGPTGSGKSAMLTALLGEMELKSGKSFLPKQPTQILPSGFRNSVAYASQSPWLQHKSIKDNILFGDEFDEERYKAVLKACALLPDLEALEDGENTEIGVKGVSMSGGQKARIALARAVYSRAAHVLLDDVLAAVDSHTGRHLYEKCLKGPLLSDRTVILVSHHVELLLPGTDYLVKILDGRIEAKGTPDELRSQGVLEGLVALEEATHAKEEPIVTQDDVDKEVVAAGGSEPAAEKKSARKLVKDEDRATGSVGWESYKLYLEASTWLVWIICIFLLAGQQASVVGERLWLSLWASAYEQSFTPILSLFMPAGQGHSMESLHHDHPLHLQHHFNAFERSHNVTGILDSSVVTTGIPSASQHPLYYLSIYAAITLGGAFLGILQSINSAWGGLKACRTIHDKMLSRVMGSTVRFFDTTPSGRIINRFSRDIEVIDSSLTSSLRTVITQVSVLIASLALVASIVPWFLLPAIFISYGYFKLSDVYLNTTRDLRRIEATKRSPIFSGFSELLDGIVVVRAFGEERTFRSKLFEQVDGSQAAFYHLWMCNRWLLVRMDALGAISVFATSILALSGSIGAGSAGIAILSAQQFVSGAYWISRFWAGLEQDFNSVERAKSYLDLPQEPAALTEGKPVPAFWPSNTTTSFLRAEKLSIKYSPELPSVLSEVSFDIKPGEKIGCLGRTGSGKSTLAMALLRFVDPAEGKIILDGIDITEVGVEELRSRITYIPQDAVLFSGTVRENLDPFNEHTDLELLQALSDVQLGAETPAPSRAPSRAPSHARLSTLVAETTSKASSVSGASGQVKITLESEVSPGGGNFSQGQRQLLAMARALLRKSNLVIADEATASIDFATDSAIQATIRSGFKDACVITIAHRLSSVIDYDRLLVLSAGKLAEFDTPMNLLRKEDSIFKSLCEQSGKYQELYRAAEKAEKEKSS